MQDMSRSESILLVDVAHITEQGMVTWLIIIITVYSAKNNYVIMH